MILFLVEKGISHVMTDYLSHVKRYLRERFEVASDITVYSQVTDIPEKYTIIIFVQRINPRIMAKISPKPVQKITPQRTNRPTRNPPTAFRSQGKRLHVAKTPPQPSSPPPQTTPSPPLKPPKKYKIFLLNTEQATVPRYVKRTISDVHHYKVPVIDYSLENISLLRKRLPGTVFIHLPFPFRPREAIPKSKDVVSLISSQYRRQVCKSVKMPIANFCGKWGAPRDQLISSSKILLNIHHHPQDYRIFESIRCYHALEMRTLVISEPSVDKSQILLKDYIIFVNNKDMNARIKDVLDNYQVYYDQVFSDARVEEIEKRFEETYRASIDKIMNLAFNY